MKNKEKRLKTVLYDLNTSPNNTSNAAIDLRYSTYLSQNGFQLYSFSGINYSYSSGNETDKSDSENDN